jgi:uncharacterized protein
MDKAMGERDVWPVDPSGVSATGSPEHDLLALNNTHARELSWLEPERFVHLLREAFLARRIGHADALLLAFNQDADYDSPNFLWFRSRYSRFVYVDRIVVAPPARGRGHARRLYSYLFRHASLAGHERVVCEINSDPPNPVSDAFHAALGFVEVGSAAIHHGSKMVRYFSRELNGPPSGGVNHAC